MFPNTMAATMSQIDARIIENLRLLLQQGCDLPDGPLILRPFPQFRQLSDIGGDAPGLAGWSASSAAVRGPEIDIGERLPVIVLDYEARRFCFLISHGGGKRRDRDITFRRSTIGR